MVDQDRRRHQRVPVQIEIAYDNDVTLTEARVNDISIGGASILTPLPLPVGSRLSIWFRGVENNVDLKARVVRVTEEDPDDEAAHPGMAVQFTEVPSQTEETLQQWIEWYSSQPEQAAPPEEPELPKVEEVSEQRYIQTQILPTIEAAPEAAPEPIEVIEAISEHTVQIEAIEVPLELETTQHEEQPEANPFATPTSEVNPFSAPTEEVIETLRLSPEEIDAKRAARIESAPTETIRMHPDDLAALQEEASEATAGSDTTVTLPEMPAFNPDEPNPASDSGERKSTRKKKKR